MKRDHELSTFDHKSITRNDCGMSIVLTFDLIRSQWYNVCVALQKDHCTQSITLAWFFNLKLDVDREYGRRKATEDSLACVASVSVANFDVLGARKLGMP